MAKLLLVWFWRSSKGQSERDAIIPSNVCVSDSRSSNRGKDDDHDSPLGIGTRDTQMSPNLICLSYAYVGLEKRHVGLVERVIHRFFKESS